MAHKTIDMSYGLFRCYLTPYSFHTVCIKKHVSGVGKAKRQEVCVAV